MRISDWSSDVCSSDLFQKIGQIARGIGTAADLRTFCGILKRAGLQRQFLHLFGKLHGGELGLRDGPRAAAFDHFADVGSLVIRSEEHTSELQSLMRISYAVFCLKKKIKKSNMQ